MKHFWAFFGALLLASGVALGAYGAHGLRNLTEVARLIESFEYAVHYQLIGGLGLFAVAFGLDHFRAGWVNFAGLLLLLGTLGFSVSLYLLVLIGWRPWPMITPLSGTLIILAWIIYMVAALTGRPKKTFY